MFRTFVFWTFGGFPSPYRPLQLLYVICCTVAIHVGGRIAWWTSLLYYVLLYCCKSVCRSLRCCCAFLSCVHGFLDYVFSSFVFLPLYRPRAGTVQRTTSPYLCWNVPYFSRHIGTYAHDAMYSHTRYVSYIYLLCIKQQQQQNLCSSTTVFLLPAAACCCSTLAQVSSLSPLR